MATYEEREESRYGGQPVEGFRFVSGETVWLYTSADREITLPIGTFTPEPLVRTALKQSKEDSGDQIEITVPRTNPIAELFIGEVPSSPVWFTQYRAHRDDETNTLTVFTGKITEARFSGSEAKLTATSVARTLARNVPTLQMQEPCNLVLYSSECGANPSSCRDSVTITTVDGRTITSNDFALRADGWFNGGRLENAAGEMRFIADHVGDTITLLSPFPTGELASLDECYAYWGCSHRYNSCNDKFSNQDNFLGWKWIPGKNPFRSRMDTPKDVHLWG